MSRQVLVSQKLSLSIKGRSPELADKLLAARREVKFLEEQIIKLMDDTDDVRNLYLLNSDTARLIESKVGTHTVTYTVDRYLPEVGNTSRQESPPFIHQSTLNNLLNTKLLNDKEKRELLIRHKILPPISIEKPMESK